MYNDGMEIWKTVPGTDGWYEVSNLGRVRSWVNGKWPGRRNTPRYLSISPGTHGYPMCRFGDRYDTVHALVAEAFLGPRPVGQEVRHKSRNKLDASVANLEYGTKQQNQGPDRLRDGTDNRGERHGMSKLKDSDVPIIFAKYRPEINSRTERRRLGLPSQADIANEYGVWHACIGKILRKERRSYAD